MKIEEIVEAVKVARSANLRCIRVGMGTYLWLKERAGEPPLSALPRLRPQPWVPGVEVQLDPTLDWFGIEAGDE